MAADLVAVDDAAYLVSNKAIRSSRVVAFRDLGMKAIHGLAVVDMPDTVAVDSLVASIHRDGPARWKSAVRTILQPA